ncbi:NAD-dependent epimerase/dehydratase family protein [Ramlibacter tataouinensis]|uniref:D-erythronate dehydrogenase n=1 Tax=Ramlibacter tataouinensis TaxID=94132 RepID=UPI0022F37E81|nr:D-erythronate dehydrogenase [Ramlibacter tataouinensis]WBY00065.1 NAD-dependent epimerase/dehydratase family protein [Ramlibacter tataouinensis]
MHILITGGSGFLGARLARQLLQHGTLALAGAPAAAIETLTLADRVAAPADLLADPRVRAVTGDLLELASARALPAPGTGAVFHLAAAVSAECEADFDLGMRSNFAATHALLEACRALGSRPLFVFASSVAVFGRQPGRELPASIGDDTLPTPQGSYGIQKFIGEQLVADYTRKGFVQGRSARLMTVSVRPGRPNGAASGFLSGMVREPLAGQRAPVPVTPDTAVALSSPARAIEGLLGAAQASGAQWGPATAINLPSLRTTVGEMAAALQRVAGPEAAALLDWRPEDAVQALVGSWPAQLQWERARGLGLAADDSFEQVIRDYARENPQAVRLPLRD